VPFLFSFKVNDYFLPLPLANSVPNEIFLPQTMFSRHFIAYNLTIFEPAQAETSYNIANECFT
jgi:hypothetical protein